MNELGNKIAKKRKDLGMSQMDFAEKMSVTRQTVSRWEAGTVMPDIDKIGDIARILGVSCDYLLVDEAEDGSDIYERSSVPAKGVSRLLQGWKGKNVRLTFFDEEADIDLYNTECRILDFEGNWMRVEANLRKGRVEKLIPVSSVCSLELGREED